MSSKTKIAAFGMIALSFAFNGNTAVIHVIDTVLMP